ncbi:phosphoribosyltransferase [Rhodococcus rhodnii]|uniref:Phosphoribosyltransferase n=2 Tax=Rhodococcus rhodnii TaxID=38312 RepID=R7WPV8_9NOCA|nr:phosphoribosyltransferase family protein [Rhodococcus rhodnii]EOM77351.1 phosphoribosyltransferase [Rhodococcus rhodnii LMG 5362]TXG91725.1 phosphoribosyltransferase [Rhodococcus rhodnii]
MRYANRADAGRNLAGAVTDLRSADERRGRPWVAPLVLALPRGGIPVAAEVARALGAPLDIALVRKLGVPGQPELAMGAIGERGAIVTNDDVVARSRIDDGAWAAVLDAERGELARRSELLRGDRPALDPRGRPVVLVDDGAATGATAIAAITDLEYAGADRVVVALPVATGSAARRLARAATVVSPYVSDALGGVGEAYRDFHQLSDDEARSALGHGHQQGIPGM